GAEAVFSKDYKLAYDGKVTIEIPKVYELINIVFTISKLDSLYPGKINWDNKYSYDVRDHFNKYKRHDLIRLVDKEIANNYSFYRNLRANSYAYRFDGNNIISKRIYTRISEGPDLLKELIPLLQDFAVKSDFLSFYQTNANYFNNLIKNYNKNIPVNEMWQWLETMFPNKVNSYKLILSPLVGNHHFTMKFKYNGFIETLMFINVIDIQNISKINVGNISRQIFTEIDHNYVNPATKVLDKQILNSMSDYKKWNSSSVYSSSIKTINEYMTWGTFTLFAWEFFEKSVFEQINLNTELIMVKSRGFTKFDLFNQELLRLYIEKSGDKSANNLFSDIISWMNSQDD
ncbi:MAG: DUF4932 domain-containing protein, partial [Bacteroidia bacterium]|nr:DUF4932 domain-containing protein [Bacteroidia bacterium]